MRKSFFLTSSMRFGLLPVRSPLLRECYRRSRHGPENKRSWVRSKATAIYYLFLQVLRCFNSLGYLHTPMCSVHDTPSSTEWVIPFGYLRITGCSPPPRSVSPVATSFIVVWCQGIHHPPFVPRYWCWPASRCWFSLVSPKLFIIKSLPLRQPPSLSFLMKAKAD